MAPIVFAAGPGALPPCVLEKAASAVLEYEGTGVSLLSISHRSPEFNAIISELNEILKELLRIPNTHTVLWMQGGASLQFAAAALNLGNLKYKITGIWSKKGEEEARKLGLVNGSTEKGHTYVCTNDTIEGTALTEDFLNSLENIVADMSSDFLSKEINVSRFDLIFAGAQKNIGCAGVTCVIIRNSLIKEKDIPTMLDYSICAKNNSCYNTPPVFAIYVALLSVRWLKEIGIRNIFSLNKKKASILYDFLDKSIMFKCFVEKNTRSQTNVVFRVMKNGAPCEELEEKLAKMAEPRFYGIRGHRSVGGFRVSLYNAVTMGNVEELVEFLKEFERDRIND